MDNNIPVYVHYAAPDGLPTYSAGVLTTDHAASSYGIPVVVITEMRRTDDPLTPGVYGSAELPGAVSLGRPITADEHRIVTAGRASGYVIADYVD